MPYDDWETSTLSVYDIINTASTTVSSSTTTTSTIVVTSTTPLATVTSSVTTETTNVTLDSNVKDTIANDTTIDNTIFSDTDNSTTNATESATDTTKVIETTTVTASSIAPLNDTDLDELLYNYLTTTHQAELLITPDVTVENASQIIPPSSTIHPIVWEVKDLTETLKFGFFTTTMISLTRVVASKDEGDLHLLLTALNTEIMRLNRANRFGMFGPVGIYTVEALAQMMALSPADLVQSQASLLNFALTTRKSTLNPEVNAIMDLIDNIYTDEDALNVITCIANIDDFPNTTKNEHEIVQELIEAVLFIPYSRIKGTHKEQLLMLEIENVISKNVNINPGPMQRRSGITFIPMRSYFRRLQRKPQKRLRNLFRRGQATRRFRNYKNFRFAATTEFVVTDLSYFRNVSINRMLKKKQRRYKKKWKKIRESERIIGTKRGKTTTTTTTTTTIKPTMHRSKYYWRKHVFKNLYKMKTTTPSTTTTKLYPWMRRSYVDKGDETCSSISDEISETSRINTNEDTIEIKSSRYGKIKDGFRDNFKDKYDDGASINRDINTNKDTIEEIKSSRHTEIKDFRDSFNENIRNEYRKSFNKKYQGIDKNIEYETTVQKPMMVYRDLIKTANKVNKKQSNFRKMHDNSDYSSDEKYLKANVLDALVHGKENGLEVYKDKRRHIVRKADTYSSYSNEEAILKAKVYKAFGYTNNFADKIKKKDFI
ncbi:unnamed protein product [Colias eurytheme]|nr:unnamed protein product [Colias eurytheme]